VDALVTGATGFLGRHLVPLLLDRGDEVRALVREGTDVGGLVGLGVEIVRGDLDDREALARAAAGRGLVFHLAGLVSWEPRDLPRLTAANVDGTRNVVAALEPGARLVHVSSDAALGPVRSSDRPGDEEMPFPAVAGRLPYSATKRAGEELVLSAAARGIDAVVANPGYLIGPGDVYGVSTWPLHRYLDGSLRYHVRGGLSFVDARDVAAGIVLLAERGRAGERTILASPDGLLSHAAFFRRVGEVTGVRRLLLPLPRPLAAALAPYVPWSVSRAVARAASHWWFHTAAKARRDLGFTTRPLDETIAATAEGSA
jgi:dihydroflavonol-4-reductase